MWVTVYKSGQRGNLSQRFGNAARITARAHGLQAPALGGWQDGWSLCRADRAPLRRLVSTLGYALACQSSERDVRVETEIRNGATAWLCGSDPSGRERGL